MRKLGIEAGIALCCGLGFALAAGGWFARFHLVELYTSSDFLEYCNAIGAGRRGFWSYWPQSRSLLPGLLPVALSRHLGILDGLALSALASAGVLGASLYGWARLFGGPRAGVAAVLAALALGPLALLPRMLSFYPELTAGFCLAGLATSAAILRPRTSTLLAAGAGVGLCLLLDVRGLVWALPYAVGGALAALVGERSPAHPPLRALASRALQLGAFLLPLALAWQVGPRIYGPSSKSLEEQVDLRPFLFQHGIQDFAPPWDRPSAYVWSRSPLRELPATVGFLARNARVQPPEGFVVPGQEGLAERHVQPLLPLSLGAALLSLVALRRRPRALLALGVGVAPFAVAFAGCFGVVEIQARFLTQALPALAVVVGVAVAWGLERLPSPGPLAARPWLRGALELGLGLGLVVGVLPSPISPAASWRAPWPRQLSGLDAALREGPFDPGPGGKLSGPEACSQELSQDRAAGHPRLGRFYGARMLETGD